VLISTKGIQGRREPRRTPLDAPSACITGGRDRPSWTTLFTTLLTQAPGDFGEWQGRAVLTGPLTPDTFRILLQEYEWYRADFQAEEAGENIRGARGELACGNLRNRREVLELLGNLPHAPLATDAEAREFIERRMLMGRGIGYIDVHLLASVALAGTAHLWTRDRRLAAVAAGLDLAFDEPT
jgi:hypothetical protein